VKKQHEEGIFNEGLCVSDGVIEICETFNTDVFIEQTALGDELSNEIPDHSHKKYLSGSVGLPPFVEACRDGKEYYA